MPTFFDPDHLTESQQARWDEACTIYRRVQHDNAARALDALSPKEREELARQAKAPTNDREALLQSLLQCHGLLVGGQEVGHPKSALFARLLNGREPLPYPPPTSFSYPWYEVVEKPGPFAPFVQVMDDAENQILINQHDWQILAGNAPAQALLALQKQLAATETREERTCHWTEDLWRAVQEAYAAGPEYRVRVPHWPDYRLWAGPATRNIQGTFVDEALRRRPANCGNVFDAIWLLPNGRHDGPDPVNPTLARVTFQGWWLAQDGTQTQSVGGV